MKDKAESEKLTGTSKRVLHMLMLIADSDGPISVRQVAKKLGLPPSTSHRLLNLLLEDGFVTYLAESATYVTGAEFYRVAARITANVNPVTMAHRAISELARKHDETLVFGLYLPGDGALTFTARADGQKKLLYRIEMNTKLSLVWGASGKAALAYLPEETIANILARESNSPASGAQPPALPDLLAELAKGRRQGYFITTGEKLPGAMGVAAPVFGPQGILGSICMTMPRERAPRSDIRNLGREIASAARELSYQIGAENVV